ncbi:MAG: glycosyltransferase [Nostoc sp. DedSLP03]|uniref:glycosyltransferase n=1 Tax=Nostoc sp. DedSLP03 TaxID=3075400 RepID=UPI002AD22F17|nr:glycosyltransferase [Nostoc sp. DedSLP03]MDZ7963835.1 glycosyltransferase [Nostoc sp. DedSLP03]
MSDEKTFSLHIFTLNAGGGHYATLKALSAIAEQQKRPWQITVTDIGQLSEPLDPYKKLFGSDGNELYNEMIGADWTWLHPVMMFFDKFFIRLLHPIGVKLGEQHWRQQLPPDLVISLIPLYNRAIWDSLQRVKVNTPMVTIMTDFADSPPHFWIEPKTKSYLICGTDRATEQARSLDVSEEHIMQTSGMIVHPTFYQPMSEDNRVERQRLGLDPDRVTGIVLFGGKGCTTMLNIAQHLDCISDRVQLIFLCGYNQKLAQALQKRPTSLRQHVQGFTDEVPYFMSLADFFIGKPGSVSISEAMVMNLPVIVEHNSSTLINEKYNAEWILEKQVGMAIKSFRQIVPAVEELLKSENWLRYKANLAAIQNQAVFEVPDILQRIIDTK